MQSDADKYLKKVMKSTLYHNLNMFFNKHPEYKFSYNELSLILGLLSRKIYDNNNELFNK